jgi:hypothetical protein
LIVPYGPFVLPFIWYRSLNPRAFRAETLLKPSSRNPASAVTILM